MPKLKSKATRLANPRLKVTHLRVHEDPSQEKRKSYEHIYIYIHICNSMYTYMYIYRYTYIRISRSKVILWLHDEYETMILATFEAFRVLLLGDPTPAHKGSVRAFSFIDF